jgi:hypothetical protein
MSFYLHRVVGSRTVLQTVEAHTLRIGRGAGCELRLDDTAVALDHAVIRREKGSYHLTDLGSVTGTYVNGEPVATTRLRDGDEVGIGGFLLKVSRSDPSDPLFLHVRSADAEPRPDAAPITAPVIDYARRYRLRHGFLSKGFLGLVVAVVAAAAVAVLPAARRLDVFRPGDLTSFHADRIDDAACGDCHEPWRGVTDARCEACHGEGRVAAAPPHHPEVLARSGAPGSAAAASAGGPGFGHGGAVPCTSCHREHVGRDGLMPRGEAPCLACHRDLRLSPGVEPVFAASVPSFAEHPEIRLTLPAPVAGGLRGSGLVRVPVSDPAARISDRAALRLNHAKHLAPGLLDPSAPAGRVQLACADCHQVEGAGMAAISFEAHCARCHALTFDDRFPGRAVAHGPPEEVAAELFLAYLEGDRRSGSVREDVRRFLVPGRRPGSSRERAAREEVRRAELRLYESRCVVCHVMDLAARPRPAVADPGLPDSWLRHARFPHAEHLQLDGLECVHCHGGAPASTATADVLLPTIGACTPCHTTGARAGEVGPAGFPVTPGPASCRACHDYHAGNRFPASPAPVGAHGPVAEAGFGDRP